MKSSTAARSPLSSAHGRVVVGVDGSPAADQALRWAADEAALRHTELEVVSCWSTPPAITPAAVAMSTEVSKVLESSARRVVDHSARIAGLRQDQIAVHRVVMRGSPGASLVGRSDGAGLLVVGRRGRSVAAEVLLGSTSAYCLHHAHCPVVVIPPPERREQQETPDLAASRRD